MKFGPCFRNSVVSPKTGQPIVPGGKPFFLYFTSFHFNKAVQQKQSPKTNKRITTKTAIVFLAPKQEALPLSPPRENPLQKKKKWSWKMVWAFSGLKLVTSVCVYIFACESVSMCLERERERAYTAKQACTLPRVGHRFSNPQ